MSGRPDIFPELHMDELDLSQKVASLLSGRIPIYAKNRPLDCREAHLLFKYWRCPCGDPGVTRKPLPYRHTCPECGKTFIIYDPER